MGNYDSGMFTLKEFYNRGVIKLAPDVLVYINGNLTQTVIAPVQSSTTNLSFNDGITNVSVQNNVDPPGSSSATIEISSPIYGENSKYWITYPSGIGGTLVRYPVFMPMMEVKIFFKGRFMVGMTPQYYPAFWGFIHAVEENYSGGMYKIVLNCADMLHWWAYSTLNVHPVPASNIMASGGQVLTAFATIFGRSNPFQILYKLTTNMGMHEFVTVSWPAQKSSLSSIYPRDLWKKATAGMMAYWQQRFRNSGALLKMYGINGKRVTKDGKQIIEPDISVANFKGNSETQKAVDPKDDKRFTLDVDYIRKFEVYADYDNMGTFENAEYMTKLDVATDVKTRTDYEFYQDVDGNFIYKPPFFNLNVKGIQPYTFLPSDIISYSSSVDIEGIVTVLTVNTPMYKNLRTTTFNLGKGFHMDIELAKKCGIKHKEITLEYVQNATMARTMALGQMGLINAKTVVGSITVPGRPEVRLGYPIYIEHRDSFHYIKSINHSFDYGGSFTTTFSLETERRKIYDPSGNLYVNKVYRLVDKNPPMPKTQENEPPPVFIVDEKEKIMRDMYIGEQRISSMTQGRYDITPMSGVSEMAATTTTVPFSDDQGYQVVGSFPYGRNVNALCTVSDTDDIPVLKEVYLTTMARPAFLNESRNMDILFFKDKEGAVPVYYEGNMPTLLGSIMETDIDPNADIIDVPAKTETKSKQTKSKTVKKPDDPGTNEAIVNACPTTVSNQNINTSPVLVEYIPPKFGP